MTPQQSAPSGGDLGMDLGSGPNTWFLRRSTSPKGISIGLAALVQLTLVTTTPPDRPSYICNNRPHLTLRIAMRPKKSESIAHKFN